MDGVLLSAPFSYSLNELRGYLMGGNRTDLFSFKIMLRVMRHAEPPTVLTARVSSILRSVFGWDHNQYSFRRAKSQEVSLNVHAPKKRWTNHLDMATTVVEREARKEIGHGASLHTKT